MHSEWFLGGNGEVMAPEPITPIDVEAHKTYPVRVKGPRPASVNRKLASISTFCDLARQQLLVEANPTESISSVREVEPAPRWLTRKEQCALLRAVQKEGNPRNEAVILLLLHTGLEVGKASDLRLSEVGILQ